MATSQDAFHLQKNTYKIHKRRVNIGAVTAGCECLCLCVRWQNFQNQLIAEKRLLRTRAQVRTVTFCCVFVCRVLQLLSLVGLGSIQHCSFGDLCVLCEWVWLFCVLVLRRLLTPALQRAEPVCRSWHTNEEPSSPQHKWPAGRLLRELAVTRHAHFALLSRLCSVFVPWGKHLVVYVKKGTCFGNWGQLYFCTFSILHTL